MSDHDAPTRFALDLPGFELEITGDRSFVEELYHRVSQDILPLIFPNQAGSKRAKSSPKKDHPERGYTWVYGMTQYYNKVYTVSNEAMRNSLLGPFLSPDHLRRIYVDRDHHDLFSALAGGQKTLWAEFTAEGRTRFQG